MKQTDDTLGMRDYTEDLPIDNDILGLKWEHEG